MTHISMIYSIGEKSFGWSWDKNGSTREAQSRREKVSSWVTAQSPALAKLLREAAYAAVLSQKATLDSPDSAEYFRVVLPLVPLYSIFLSAKDTQTGPSAVLRSVGGDVSARLLGYLDENVTLDFPSHAPTKWNGELVGGRDEKLGRLRLEPKTGPESGAFKSRFVTLEWTAGSRAERFNFILYGPAEGYFGKLERKVGGDWATVVTLEGLGPIDSEGWWDQYRIGDKYEKEGTFQCVEIPPSGQAERQRRRAALLDAVRDAMARSGVPQADSEEVLFRWQRILNLPDSKESLPALAPLAEILADAPIPVFRLEADGPWAGAVRLVH